MTNDLRIGIGLLAIFALFASGCSIGASNRSGAVQRNYDWESRSLHPEFMVYHHRDDSSEFWIKLRSSELLHARKAPESPFEGHLDCTVRVQKFSDGQFADIDTFTVALHDVEAASDQRFILKKTAFALQTEAVYRLLVKATDVNRRTDETGLVEVVKAPFSTRQDYLIFEADAQAPLFGDDIREGSRLRLETARGELLLRQTVWDPGWKLPPPPFTDGQPETPQLPTTLGSTFMSNGTGIQATGPLLSVTTNAGAHVFTLRVHQSSYPEVSSLTDMIESLRYISSRREHEKMNESKNGKRELDAFWLDCGGSKDRTRELIRIYYGRVEEANRQFSSFAEGWKTDRGLVHIVFGNPARILMEATEEVWIYGDENSVSSVRFVFERIATPVTSNHYILKRNFMYRTDWDRSVTYWRNGRIFQE